MLQRKKGGVLQPRVPLHVADPGFIPAKSCHEKAVHMPCCIPLKISEVHIFLKIKTKPTQNVKRGSKTSRPLIPEVLV